MSSPRHSLGDAARAGVPLSGQAKAVAAVIDHLSHTMSVSIVGVPTSGRSTLLSLVGAELRDRDHTVLTVRGVEGLRTHPLGALTLALSAPLSSARTHPRAPQTIAGVGAVLRSALVAGPSVVLIDGTEHLDSATIGVLQAVTQEVSVPVVSAHAYGPGSTAAVEALGSNAMRVEIAPLSFDEADQLLRELLGAPVDPSTVSGLRAFSGGAVGLLLGTATAASREKRLTLRRGSWSTALDLWSPALSARARHLLAPLTEGERRALDRIARTSLCEVTTALHLTDASVLDSLTARRLIAPVDVDGRRFVVVAPPLVAEYLRQSATATVPPVDVVDPDGVRAADGFFQLVREKSRAEGIAARDAWRERPVARTALRYLKSIEGDPAGGSVAHEIFEKTDAADRTVDDATLAVQRARWAALENAELDAARLPPAESARSDESAELIAAARRVLVATFAAVPNDASGMPAADGTPLAPAPESVTESRLFVLVSRARFLDAEEVFHRATHHASGAVASPTSCALRGLALIGQGRAADAARFLDEGIRSAREALDRDGMRVLSLVRMFSHLLDGDLELAERSGAVIEGVGEPAGVLRGQRQAYLNMSGVIAARSGRVDRARQYAASLAEIPGPDGPLPGQSSAWLDAQLHASAGDLAHAASTLWDASLALWSRNAFFSAALGMLSAVETQRDDARLLEASDRIAKLGSPLLDAQLAYATALHHDDPAALADSVPALVETGRRSIAVEALRSAIRLFRAAGDEAAARRCEKRAEAVVRSFHGHALDTARFHAGRLRLSGRELEVARLAAEGSANGEIAGLLQLSVRTVESHLYRSLRKLGLSNRHELRHYLPDFPDRD